MNFSRFLPCRCRCSKVSPSGLDRTGVFVSNARAYPGLEFVSWMSSNGWPRLEFLSRMVGQDWSLSGLRCKARPEVFSWSSWPGQAYVGDYLWFSVYNYCPVIHNAQKLWNVFLSITRLVDFLYSFTRDVEFLYSITIASEFFYSITVSVEFLYSITRHVQFLLSFARVASCGLNCLYFIRMSCGIPLFTRIPALSLLYSQKMWIWWFTDFVDCQNRLCGLSKLNSPYYPNGKDWLAQADTPLPAETGD